MSRSDNINMARYLAGEMSAGEEIAFRKDLEASPDQTNLLSRMEKHWKYFDENPAHGSADSSLAWNRLHRRLERDGLLEQKQTGNANRRLYRTLRVAATILLILSVGVPALYFGLIRDHQAVPEIRRVAENGITAVDLPDGSRVTLNQGGTITYPESFAQERSLELTGEAFFEVMSDPQHPFSVHTGKVVVGVVGTSFNVKPADHSRDVEVYVTSGKVRMSLENSESTLTLEPGEVGTGGNSRLTKLIQQDQNYISWKTKDFKFVDAALKDVLVELEESYHVNINTARADLNDMRITTTYSQQSIDAILETICTAFGLTISSGENGYYLSN